MKPASIPAADPDARPRIRRRPDGREVRERRRRMLTWGLSIVLGILVVSAVVGETGYFATLRAEREEADLRAEVAALRRENQQMQARMQALESDPVAREELAREHGYLRPGETLFIINDEAPAVGPASGTDSSR